MTLGVAWSDSQSHLGLEKLQSSTLNGSISFDIWDHIQLGVTGRKEYEKRTGLKRTTNSDGTQYIYFNFKDVSQTITTSVDLTLVLYNGPISPFIFGGVARREYKTLIEYPEFDLHQETNDTLDAVPNGGYGIAIFLGRGFSLKFTQTFTEGQKITIDGSKRIETKVYDQYTQVGLNYRI
jgi:hypothetical protein